MLLIAAQPDLGTALVIGFTLAAMLVAAGIPLRQLGLIAGGVAFLIMMFALFEPYRRDRLTAFLNPWDHAGTIGFQSVQGQIAIGSGGLFGVGPGQSVQKIFYLPEAHTDFILAVIGEELGLAGICGLLALYGMIGYAGLRTAKAAKGAYAKLLATGLTSLILCQALLNIYTVLGLAPLTGVPLPFISSGSTSLITLLLRHGPAAQRRERRLRRTCGRSSRARRGGRRVSAPRIVIAAGGTAGHVVPAIAVADALRAEGAEVRFVGGQRAEAELVPGRRLPARPDPGRGDLAQQPPQGRPRRRQGRARAAGRPRDPPPPAGRRRPRRRRVRRRAGRRRGGAARGSRSSSPRPTRTWA